MATALLQSLLPLLWRPLWNYNSNRACNIIIVNLVMFSSFSDHIATTDILKSSSAGEGGGICAPVQLVGSPVEAAAMAKVGPNQNCLSILNI